MRMFHFFFKVETTVSFTFLYTYISFYTFLWIENVGYYYVLYVWFFVFVAGELLAADGSPLSKWIIVINQELLWLYKSRFM